MSRVRGAHQVPPLPQVNLLPPEVRVSRAQSRVKRWLVAVVALVVLLSGGVYVWGMQTEAAALAELRLAEDETARLQAEEARYAEVPRVRAQLAAAEISLLVGTSTEVMWRPYIEAVAASAPEGVSIERLAVAGATPVQAPAEPTDPLQAPSVGTISFTANSATVVNLADWLDALETVPGLADPWFTQAAVTDDDGTVYYTVTASVQVDETAYANRFVNEES